MIKNFEPRLYQQTIFNTACTKNTLVVLPTGMGKTNVFLMIAAQRLRQYPKSKIVLLGPTKPLISQYKSVFENCFEIDKNKMAIFTGTVKPEKRAELWKDCQIIFSTPQGMENDIINRRIDLKDVSLIGFDEAHKAVGDYSYVWIAKKYEELAKYPRIVAMTASPGADLEKISEVCKNLNIEDVEVRTSNDPDVRPYIQKMDIKYVEVELSEELKRCQSLLKECYLSKCRILKERGYLSSEEASKKDLLLLQGHLHGEIKINKSDFEAMKSISIAAEAMKVQHALELLETQGVETCYNYMKELELSASKRQSKAAVNLVSDLNFRKSYLFMKDSVLAEMKHPKLIKLKDVVSKKVKNNKDVKLIIFNQFRDSGDLICKEINTIEGIEARLFVGQAKKSGTGLTQKEQLKMLEDFREGVFNVIIMTSVGEEGLDIPCVDTVIFYEPIPSAIRHIQRRGRTGRQEKGEVLVFITKNTRDEIYRWSAFHKENRMHRVLKDLKTTFHKERLSCKYDKTLGVTVCNNQKVLSEYNTKDAYMPELDVLEKPIIYVDNREKGNDISKKLIDIGANVNVKQLATADYIVSAKCGIEYKKGDDFLTSLLDGRLLEQVSSLSENFEKPVIIVETASDIYSIRNIHPNAIRGLIATINVDFRIPIIYTKDSNETAEMIYTIARREQKDSKKDFQLHFNKKKMSDDDKKEYLISSIPEIGSTLAKELLLKFGSVEKVINSSVKDLENIPGIGKIKANKIKQIFQEIYLPNNKK